MKERIVAICTNLCYLYLNLIAFIFIYLQKNRGIYGENLCLKFNAFWTLQTSVPKKDALGVIKLIKNRG